MWRDVRDSSFVARAHSIVLQSLAHISSTAQYICSIFVSYPIDSFWDSAQCSSTQYNMQEWHCIIVSQLKITSINCYFLLPKLKWKKKLSHHGSQWSRTFTCEEHIWKDTDKEPKFSCRFGCCCCCLYTKHIQCQCWIYLWIWNDLNWDQIVIDSYGCKCSTS